MIKRLTSPLLFLTALALSGHTEAHRNLATCELNSGLAVSGNANNGEAFSDMLQLETLVSENSVTV